MLTDQVLVLNNSYNPINICSTKRALKMLMLEKAEVITVENGEYCNYNVASWSEISQIKRELNLLNEDEAFIGTFNNQIIVPRVIRVLHYSKTPNRKVKLNRKNIYARDDNTCQYCGGRFNSEDLNLDHVLPRSQGGVSSWTNLVCSCYACNGKKANRTPEQAHMKLIKLPYEPKAKGMFRVEVAESNRIKYQSWTNFVSDLYWNSELSK